MPLKISLKMSHSAISAISPIVTAVSQAQAQFRQKLEQVEARGGLTLEQYVRYLSMQFHLTKDVQRHFFQVAGHSSLAATGLRNFLIDFGLEEEMHYRIAQKDLENLGAEIEPAPLDVQLWWAYFDSIIINRPFVRLGATCILENLGSGCADIAKRLMRTAPFISERSSRFMQIHLHEELPHGEQVLNALSAANLNQPDLTDLAEGAAVGAVLYLRMVDWALAFDANEPDLINLI